MKNQIRVMMITGFAVCVSGACKTAGRSVAGSKGYPAFFKVGHRGTRGLMPENTIPAMEKGIEVGANTVELDVHISRDGQVLVYHDESFNPDYTSMPDGSDIPKDQRKKYTFYQMDYPEIRKFIIGRKDYPAFPQQQRMDCYTPLLGEMIDSVEAFTKSHHLPDVYWLVEIKSKEKTDGFEQPVPEEYIKILMPVLESRHLGKRLIVQSFDMRPLQVIHRLRPDISLGFLTDDKNATFDDNIAKLGFIPAFYNPNYHLVTATLVKQCHDKQILIEPWTVETPDVMQQMKALGVDGIITDYPNLLK
ncbi:MAG TPA: glycerophosphodiester phosphodiesterase family protein [Puia sp.]|jgi:glycerophosphoryl diester phosphodiesterase|nr:glycerophosphodiester phosphodiesterase family protein [Puia sp.]